MKRLVYLSMTMLCLALAALIGFHLGGRPVEAQTPEPITDYRIAVAGGQIVHYVMLSNGDVWAQRHAMDANEFSPSDAKPTLVGNFWGKTPRKR